MSETRHSTRMLVCIKDIEGDEATYTIMVSKAMRQVHVLTAKRNFTINLSEYIPGGEITLILKQDSTGSRTITLSSDFDWDGADGAPTLTTTASSIDLFTFISDAAKLLEVSRRQNIN